MTHTRLSPGKHQNNWSGGWFCRYPAKAVIYSCLWIHFRCVSIDLKIRHEEEMNLGEPRYCNCCQLNWCDQKTSAMGKVKVSGRSSKYKEIRLCCYSSTFRHSFGSGSLILLKVPPWLRVLLVRWFSRELCAVISVTLLNPLLWSLLTGVCFSLVYLCNEQERER